MIQTGATLDSDLERISRRLEELRRSFDENTLYAPPDDSRKTEQFLQLTLCGEAYAFPLAHVLEIIQVPTIVPVPGVPTAIVGIVNFRGQILSVTTIHGALGLTAGETGPDTRIVVIKGLSLVTGILVDAVNGIIQVADEAVQPVPATVQGHKARLLAGQIYNDGKLVSLLNMEQLCESKALTVPTTGPTDQAEPRRTL